MYKTLTDIYCNLIPPHVKGIYHTGVVYMFYGLKEADAILFFYFSTLKQFGFITIDVVSILASSWEIISSEL